jgi:hypothetical protein
MHSVSEFSILKCFSESNDLQIDIGSYGARTKNPLGDGVVRVD